MGNQENSVRESIRQAVNAEAKQAARIEHPANERIQEAANAFSVQEAQKDKAESRLDPETAPKDRDQQKAELHQGIRSLVRGEEKPKPAVRFQDNDTGRRNLLDKLDQAHKAANLTPTEKLNAQVRDKFSAYVRANSNMQHLDNKYVQAEISKLCKALPHIYSHQDGKFSESFGIDIKSAYELVCKQHGEEPYAKPKASPLKPAQKPKRPTKPISVRDSLKQAIREQGAR